MIFIQTKFFYFSLILFLVLLLPYGSTFAILTLDDYSFHTFTNPNVDRIMLYNRNEGALSLSISRKLNSQLLSDIRIIRGSLAPVVGEYHFLGVQDPHKLIQQSKVIGDVFNYPNPFRLGDGTYIGYELSRDMDIDIYVYDVFGHQIWETHRLAGEEGGRGGGYYNRIPFSQLNLSAPLSASVYFYLVVHQGEILAKSKMAVIP